MGCVRSESRSSASAAAGASKGPMSKQLAMSWAFITLSFFTKIKDAAAPHAQTLAGAPGSIGRERTASRWMRSANPPCAVSEGVSLHLHVVLDGFHALDAACQFDRSIRLGLRTDETTQLNLAVIRGDLDVQNLGQRIFDNRCLHLGRDDRV